MNHQFIFQSGIWRGEGKITLSMSEEPLSFSTCWKIPEKNKEGCVESLQEIEVIGFPDVMHNQLAFYNVTDKNFQIALKNQSLGKVVGKGVVNENFIGWEFLLAHLGFEGFEFYEKRKESDGYLMHAEYATREDFRTTIHGKIWHVEKSSPTQEKKDIS